MHGLFIMQLTVNPYQGMAQEINNTTHVPAHSQRHPKGKVEYQKRTSQNSFFCFVFCQYSSFLIFLGFWKKKMNEVLKDSFGSVWSPLWNYTKTCSIHNSWLRALFDFKMSFLEVAFSWVLQQKLTFFDQFSREFVGFFDNSVHFYSFLVFLKEKKRLRSFKNPSVQCHFQSEI